MALKLVEVRDAALLVKAAAEPVRREVTARVDFILKMVNSIC
jgi:hypothetical protein